jgi:aldehyde:ferredoxin oxidoreductase
MPRSKTSMALAYACNGYGPDHVSSEHDLAMLDSPVNEGLQGMGFYETQQPSDLDENKARFYAYSQRWTSAIDSVGTCFFTFNIWSILSLKDLLDLINTVTGWEYTFFEFMLLGERRVNMVKAFNTREGFTSEDDMLPERLFTEPIKNNFSPEGTKIDKDDFLNVREHYYGMNGWDPKTGIPSKYKMTELGLSWAMNFLS